MASVTKCKSTYSRYNFLLGGTTPHHDAIMSRKLLQKSALPSAECGFLGWQLVPILMVIVLALFTLVCFSATDLPWETQVKVAVERDVNLSTLQAWPEIIKLENLQMMTTV